MSYTHNLSSLNRREAIKLGVMGAAGAALSAGGGSAVAQAVTGSQRGNRRGGRPNILILLTDEQSVWTLGCYGARDITTPHIDSIARQGARFDNFFCNSAVCTPSRGCILTGLQSRFHKAFGNNQQIDLSSESYAHVLRDAGYATGYSGKWHLNGSLDAMNERIAKKLGLEKWDNGLYYKHSELFDDWISREHSMGFEDCHHIFEVGHQKSVDPKPRPEHARLYVEPDEGERYMTDWIGDCTIEFLNKHKDEPFCYVASIPDPHTPISVRAPHDTMFDPAEVDLDWSLEVPDWFQPHMIDRLSSELEAKRAKMPLEAHVRQRKATYLGMVKRIDDQVGRVLNELRRLNLEEDTLVIFTADHGEQMGQHGVFGKAQPFDFSYRVPFLMRWPGRIQPGTVVEQCASTVDLKPTLCAAVGATPEQESHGHSFLPLLDGDAADWDDLVLTQTVMRICGTINREHMVSFFFDQKNKRLATPTLFDRRNDPRTERNLAADPRHRDLLRDYHAEMLRRYRDLGSPDVPLMAAGWA